MNLSIPNELEELIQSGFWPATAAASRTQALKPLISVERIKAFAPEEDNLCLYRPPFHTVAKEMAGNDFWRRPEAAIHEIDPSLAVIIGDFGLGSDTAIILDYRADSKIPSVLRLRWSTDPTKPPFTDNHWVLVAKNFAEFIKMLRG